jgi:hypothetical protein
MGSGGAGQRRSPCSSTSAPLTASSLSSIRNWPLLPVEKGPMDSRNLEMLLE